MLAPFVVYCMALFVCVRHCPGASVVVLAGIWPRVKMAWLGGWVLGAATSAGVVASAEVSAGWGEWVGRYLAGEVIGWAVGKLVISLDRRWGAYSVGVGDAWWMGAWVVESGGEIVDLVGSSEKVVQGGQATWQSVGRARWPVGPDW